MLDPFLSQNSRKIAVCDWPSTMYCKQSKRNSINRYFFTPPLICSRIVPASYQRARAHQTSLHAGRQASRQAERKSKIMQEFRRGTFFAIRPNNYLTDRGFWNKLGNEHVSAPSNSNIRYVFDFFFTSSTVKSDQKGKKKKVMEWPCVLVVARGTH
ncbi:hypothetical protein L873DRAFT_185102 [Choiromyces venosus 120613-1]|uniref:Uncharacterized protein n=1 Tax=Choiromyces venosus 120613-1 TaxID=1336337 RepID=A0A3N4J655_9PEZI|nr:hypothetical protein L873DRAFT_185102 [Choiromyces venosus 120613-1]